MKNLLDYLCLFLVLGSIVLSTFMICTVLPKKR